MCEALCPAKKFDFHLRGQSFYFIEDYKVKRIDFRGNVVDVSLIIFHEELRNKGVPMWWGGRSCANIPLKLKEDQIIPPNKQKSSITVEDFVGLSSLPRIQAIINGDLLDMGIMLKKNSVRVGATTTRNSIGSAMVVVIPTLTYVAKRKRSGEDAIMPNSLKQSQKKKSHNNSSTEIRAPTMAPVKCKKLSWELELGNAYSTDSIHKACIQPVFDVPPIVFGSDATVSMKTNNFMIKHEKHNITKGHYTVAHVNSDPVKKTLDYSVHGASNEDCGWRYPSMYVGLFVDSDGVNRHVYQNTPHAKKASWSAMLLMEKAVSNKVKIHRHDFIRKHGCNLRKFTVFLDQNTKEQLFLIMMKTSSRYEIVNICPSVPYKWYSVYFCGKLL
jgi:hypothetical protein